MSSNEVIMRIQSIQGHISVLLDYLVNFLAMAEIMLREPSNRHFISHVQTSIEKVENRAKLIASNAQGVSFESMAATVAEAFAETASCLKTASVMVYYVIEVSASNIHNL